MQDLPIGAHLTTPRRGYQHHGIYAGGGRVIHYAGFSRFMHRGAVEEVSLADFTGGRAVEVQAWVAPKFSGADCVARARTRLGEDNYRLLANNCEHFATWCISGTGRSKQVEAWRVRVGRFLNALTPATRRGAGVDGPLAA